MDANTRDTSADKLSLEPTRIRPGINARGFITAVKDYTEPAVVEELAANSYDADATTVLVLLDPRKNQLHVLDDGSGFTCRAIEDAAVLGGGDKREVEFSTSKRPYLGAYDFGLKATLKIANSVQIKSVSNEGHYSVLIDWRLLDDALRPNGTGFPMVRKSRARHQATGTHLILELRSPTGDIIDEYVRILGNLPDDGGKCQYYAGLYSKVSRELGKALADFKTLKHLAQSWAKRRLVVRSAPSADPDLRHCTEEQLHDKEDKQVSARIYFTGFEGDKVRPLKKGLRGIYIRIHGRLLKHSFDDQKYVYGISKWVKFASGIRVELDIDWLRSEISLSRDGLTFSNPKLEEQFARTLARNVSAFIQPKLKGLEKRAQKHTAKRHAQRMELARRRSRNNTRGIRLKGLQGGFTFRPETDGELALLLANPPVLESINRHFTLIDYNDQAAFDCVLYDKRRRELICCELEPTLVEFTQHRNAPEELTLIITWSLGKWRIGARKKGVGATYQLNEAEDRAAGRYKLLSFARENAKTPSSHFDVVVLDELLQLA